jgi:hypothetical protein
VVEIEPVVAEIAIDTKDAETSLADKLSDAALETDPAAAEAATGGCDTKAREAEIKMPVDVLEAQSFASDIDT